MDLREPKKKKRVRLQAQPSLPISTNDNGEWRVYTAHLSASGTCIVDPVEMEAVHSMGFFGKGSLSRSYPSFGRRRFGAPPIIRNRQWTRRQHWLEELESLNEDSNSANSEIAMENGADGDSRRQLVEEESCKETSQESTLETSAVQEKMADSKTNENCVVVLNTDKACDKETPQSDSKVLGELETTPETRVDNNSSIELIADNKAPEIHSKVQEELEKLAETRTDNDSSIELAAINKAPEIDSKVPEELEETTENNSCIELIDNNESKKTDAEASANLTKTIVHEIEPNSSIEFIGEQSSVKRARMYNSEENDSDKRKNASSVVRDDSMNVDEVLLDSTEDEEICEIVEKETNNMNDWRSSLFDDVCVLNDHLLPEKSNSRSEFDEAIIEEETNPYEILVLPDTDSDTDNYLKNVKSRIERDGFPVNETLHLTFEETFFLMYGLGCLQLMHYDGSIFSISNAWNYFQQQDKYFIQKYVVYHYFRSKGWIVKPGMKFGGDFLLYKQGPPFYHASYIVVIEVMDADTLILDDVKSMRKISWKNLMGLERLSETIAKEILFAQILWPSSIVRNGNTMTPEALSEFTVRELLWRRWNPKRKHDIASVDEEDSDSM